MRMSASSGCCSRARCPALARARSRPRHGWRSTFICAIKAPSNTVGPARLGGEFSSIEPGLLLQLAPHAEIEIDASGDDVVGVGRTTGKIDAAGIGRVRSHDAEQERAVGRQRPPPRRNSRTPPPPAGPNRARRQNSQNRFRDSARERRRPPSRSRAAAARGRSRSPASPVAARRTSTSISARRSSAKAQGFGAKASSSRSIGKCSLIARNRRERAATVKPRSCLPTRRPPRRRSWPQ